jgi:hypothetical protein
MTKFPGLKTGLTSNTGAVVTRPQSIYFATPWPYVLIKPNSMSCPYRE